MRHYNAICSVRAAEAHEGYKEMLELTQCLGCMRNSSIDSQRIVLCLCICQLQPLRRKNRS